MKYLGIIIILIGVLVLVLYFFGMFSSNVALVTAAVLMILGLVSFILLNKYIDDK